MSHTAYFQRLLGKTITAVKHVDDRREAIVITFDDGTIFEVWAYGEYALDSKFIEPTP